MNKSFEHLTEENLIKNWIQFLNIQAQLCFEKDMSFMSKMGLKDWNHPILDFGCGAGAYTHLLSKHFPQSTIIATDINDALLQEFGSRLKSESNSNIQIFRWNALTDKAPDIIKSCWTCIMRMVLQHVPDPCTILTAVKNILPSGAKIVIIEEDDGFFQIHPELPEFWRIIDTWSCYAKTYVRDCYLGRKLPQLVSKCGYQLKYWEIVSHTNLDWGMDSMIEFFLGTLYLIQTSDPKIISLEEIKQIEKAFVDYKELYDSNCFVVYPQVITVAEIP